MMPEFQLNECFLPYYKPVCKKKNDFQETFSYLSSWIQLVSATCLDEQIEKCRKVISDAWPLCRNKKGNKRKGRLQMSF